MPSLADKIKKINNNALSTNELAFFPSYVISKQAQKKTRGSRNVVTEKNDENIMDGEEIK